MILIIDRSTNMAKLIARVAALLALLLLAGTVLAQEQSYGEAEYLNSCAACHGPNGKGDGPMADVLMKRPADLTVLQERNDGEFPYHRVFSVEAEELFADSLKRPQTT
jgi:mono/diheme cytochrome c family protein